MMTELKDSIEVIQSLLLMNSEITGVKFVTFNGYDIIQNRIKNNKQIDTVLVDAFKIRNDFRFPFWDCFNVSLFNKAFENFNFFDQIKFHNTKENELLIEVKFIKQFLKQIDLEAYLTFNSKVSFEESEPLHFPLLDFHIPVGKENEKICIEVIKSLSLKGYLLDSGKSYHFYGSNLVNETRLIDILSHSLLYAPIIDKSWVAHQLIERSCCLRISKKYSRIPIVIDYIQ